MYQSVVWLLEAIRTLASHRGAANMTDTGSEENGASVGQWRPEPRVARPELTGAGAMFSVQTPAAIHDNMDM